MNTADMRTRPAKHGRLSKRHIPGHRAQPDATICGMHAHDIRPAPPAAHQIELQEPEPDQVRAARKCAGHTQTQAGQLVGGALRTWQDWESGKRAMPAATLALYLLLTDQHPDMRLTRKKSRSGG